MTPTLFDLALKAGFSDPIEGWMGEAYEERLEAFAKLIIDYEIATKIANVTGELTNDALRQAMDYSMPLYTTPPAAPAQEPVAWMWRCKPYCEWPTWSVSLTRPADSGRDGHKRTDGYEDVPLYTTPPAAPAQEPVAWIYSQGAAKVVSMNYVPGVRATPLYTTPPAAQRQWVGLTDGEISAISREIYGYEIEKEIRLARAIEAKLKEQNT